MVRIVLTGAAVCLGVTIGAIALCRWLDKHQPQPNLDSRFWGMINSEEWLQYDGQHDGPVS